MKIRFVREMQLNKLAGRINTELANGWELYGSIVVTYPVGYEGEVTYIQALTHPNPPLRDTNES